MGFYQTQGASETPTTHEALAHNSISQEEEGTIRPTVTSAGRIVVYGDSNCADNSHMQKGSTIFNRYCYFVLDKYQLRFNQTAFGCWTLFWTMQLLAETYLWRSKKIQMQDLIPICPMVVALPDVWKEINFTDIPKFSSHLVRTLHSHK